MCPLPRSSCAGALDLAHAGARRCLRVPNRVEVGYGAFDRGSDHHAARDVGQGLRDGAHVRVLRVGLAAAGGKRPGVSRRLLSAELQTFRGAGRTGIRSCV